MFDWLFRKKNFRYKCSSCGDYHHGSPSFAIQHPTYFFDVPEDERSTRVQLGDDICKISPHLDEPNDATIYCIRAILEIPLTGTEDPFTWGVWVSQSKNNFDRFVETFETDQSTDGSFGWLPVDLPYYNKTHIGEPIAHLECDVHWGANGQRPKVKLWDNAHQLAVDQMDGVSWKQALEIAKRVSEGLSCKNSP